MKQLHRQTFSVSEWRFSPFDVHTCLTCAIGLLNNNFTRIISPRWEVSLLTTYHPKQASSPLVCCLVLFVVVQVSGFSIATRTPILPRGWHSWSGWETTLIYLPCPVNFRGAAGWVLATRTESRTVGRKLVRQILRHTSLCPRSSHFLCFPCSWTWFFAVRDADLLCLNCQLSICEFWEQMIMFGFCHIICLSRTFSWNAKQ